MVLLLLVAPLSLALVSGAVSHAFVAPAILLLLALTAVGGMVPLVRYRRTARVEVSTPLERAFDAIGKGAWALAIPGLQQLAIIHQPAEGRLMETGTRLSLHLFARMEGGLPKLTRPHSWSTRHSQLGRRWETQGTLTETPGGTLIEVEYSVRVSIGLTRDARNLQPAAIEAALRRLKSNLERSVEVDAG